MVIWFDLSWSETWIISKYKKLLNCCDKSMTRVQTNALGDAICENVLQILDIGAPKPRFWKRSRSASIGRDNGKWSAGWWDLWEWAPMLIPELQEFHGPFAQMVIFQQKLIKAWSRDTMVCERVRKVDTYPSRSWILMTKTRFDPAGHKKKAQQQKSRFAGPSLYGVKMKILENEDSS